MRRGAEPKSAHSSEVGGAWFPGRWRRHWPLPTSGAPSGAEVALLDTRQSWSGLEPLQFHLGLVCGQMSASAEQRNSKKQESKIELAAGHNNNFEGEARGAKDLGLEVAGQQSYNNYARNLLLVHK